LSFWRDSLNTCLQMNSSPTCLILHRCLPCVPFQSSAASRRGPAGSWEEQGMCRVVSINVRQRQRHSLRTAAAFFCLPKSCNNNTNNDLGLFSLPLLITVSPVSPKRCDFSLGFQEAVGNKGQSVLVSTGCLRTSLCLEEEGGLVCSLVLLLWPHS